MNSDATGASANPDSPTANGTLPDSERFGVPVQHIGNRLVLHAHVEQYRELVDALADDGFHFLADLTAVDYLDHPDRDLPAGIVPGRFEVVLQFRDFLQRRLVRVRVQVPGDQPTLPSLYDIFPGSEAMEREVFDMFGIVFADHPDPTRILMPEDFDGHPLRKDYEVGRIPVQFKEANS